MLSTHNKMDPQDELDTFQDVEDSELNFDSQLRSRANTWPSSRFVGKDSVQSSDIDGGAQSAEDATYGQSSDDCINIEDANAGNAGAGTSTFASTVAGLHATGQGKKNSSRRNAWGNFSYADLITQAIDSSVEKRLTLSQIYDWMVQNVPYFKDKGDSNSSAGWKNSIRHNLSLHNRFKREQNEGTGKSSWWTINPDAKPGKSTRRRAATMDTPKYEKRRGRIRKQTPQDEMRLRVGSDAGAIPFARRSPSSPIREIPEYQTTDSVSPHLHNPVLQALQEPFRSRTSSNASSYGRLSPLPSTNFDDTSSSPHPWTHDYGVSRTSQLVDNEFHPQMADLDAQMTHSMQLHDADHLLDKPNSGRNGQFFRNTTGNNWNNDASSNFSSGQQQMAVRFLSQTSPKLDAFPGNMLNTTIFSGGSYTSNIPEDKPRQMLTQQPPQHQQRQGLPSMTSQFGQSPRVLNQPVRGALPPLRSSLPANTNINSNTCGSLPADLDLFMDTQSGFLGVDVDEFLEYEKNAGGDLLDVNFDSCFNNGNPTGGNK